MTTSIPLRIDLDILPHENVFFNTNFKKRKKSPAPLSDEAGRIVKLGLSAAESVHCALKLEDSDPEEDVGKGGNE